MENTFKQHLTDIIYKNKEGFTYTLELKPTNFKRGYFVALTNNSHKNINKAIQNLLKLKEDYKQISKNLFIGGWLSDDNTYFLDLSLRFENRKDALIMGKLQKQQSIFNIKNKNCIEVLN